MMNSPLKFEVMKSYKMECQISRSVLRFCNTRKKGSNDFQATHYWVQINSLSNALGIDILVCIPSYRCMKNHNLILVIRVKQR